MKPRPHPLARAKLVCRLDRMLGSAWDRGWLNRPPLDPAELFEKAAIGVRPGGEEGGRRGDEVADFRLRLDRLTDSLSNEARLNSLGLAVAHGQLVRVIRQRLRLGRWWARYPHLYQTPVAPPILVVGQMRAGTTRIHRLLAADPAHAATRFCDSWNPVPQKAPDLRALKSTFALMGARRIDPWIDSIHPFGARRADEELGWLASALDHCAYEAQWRIPGFTAFSEARDPAPIYREFARILATDAARHGNADRPRVMKVPQFAEDLATVLEQFPDAKVVVAMREPKDVARSAASLVANQMTIQSDEVDYAWIKREWDRKIALRQRRMDEALATFDGRVARVDFAALEDDWEGEIAQVYRALGLKLTPEAQRSMQAEQRRSDQTPHAGHRIQMRQFQTA
ncbi:MAG TPA: sulfotransferase [Sphingomonadaceae bacterium]|nr:sulfotransferase [Sphingomonadaceae bacterium]